MDQNELHKKLGRPVSWAITSNPEENEDNAISNNVDKTDEEVPSNYQAMGESYSDTTNFEVNKEPGRLN
ncbi:MULTISPECIES: hypothetical protein [unclassified Paenibacillus]|uniref:hypothetical protein n=1 Tax=unclassified Paenibacillus TaxID=185978 RepID=UPI00071056FE|nr:MULTISPECIES: hypothetical protein [unclassified Paenibacillus]KQX56624.1 hypothetical protein ASD40_04280 [Paenibacillus sp. Root444D2]KRE45957.1 hypothetical protein ASG85_30850 [Paenibacillus sp. Soil724D2]